MGARSGRGVIAAAVAVMAALGLAAATPAPARASCDAFMLPFGEYAGQAQRIVIGDVVTADPSAPWRDQEGNSSRFTLRVLYAVRGEASGTISIRDLQYAPCADHIVLAGAGDRIALAFDITSPGFDPPALVASVAWLRGGPSYLTPADRVTVAAVYALAGSAPPATTTEAVGGERGRADGPGIALLGPLVGALAGMLLWRRRRGSAALVARRPRLDAARIGRFAGTDPPVS